MARRARARRPQVQRDINGTLIAIARETQARNDSNIMDAWRNGGEFQGAKVTDDIALAYWRKRMAGLAKNDPAYDTAKSQIMQLQYGIEQSKADLRYVQGKIGDREYAKFFINWAKKVPRNSEFWRVLQKDAARLLENAKEKARINGEKAKQDSFNRFVEDRNKDIGLGNALTDAINRLSQETGLSVTGNGERLLELLTEDYQEHPDRYHALQDSIKVAGGDFSGTFTSSWVGAQVGAATEAYDDVAVRAQKDGYVSAYNTATKGQADMSSWAANIEVWSVAKAYDTAYQAFARVWNDPNVSYRDKQSAAQTFSTSVGKLAETPGIDNATQQMLLADATRATGEDAGDAPSFGTAQLGHPGMTPEIQQAVAYQREAQALMDTNPGAYVYAPMTADGQYDPSGKSPVGIVPAQAVGPDAVFIAQPGLDGKPSMVALSPHTVYVKDPNDPGADPVAIGKTISYQVGGRAITMYGYQDQAGNARWSLRSPYADGVQGVNDKEGNLILTLPGQADPAARAAQIDAKYGTNLGAQMAALTGGGSASSVVYQRDEEGKVTAKLTVKYDGTGFNISQANISRDEMGREVEGDTTTVPVGINTPLDLSSAALAPSRLSGESVAGAYTSPLAGSVAASAATMTGNQVAALAQDPAFQHAFVTQTMQTLGITNPLDPRVVEAWGDATDAANRGWGGQDARLRRGVKPAIEREDLDYPGAKADDPTKTSATITFGGRDIKVPGLPAYLNSLNGGQPPAVNLNGISDFLGGAAQFAQSLLAPGQLPGQPAAPGTAPVTPVAPPTYKVTTVPPPVASSAPPPTVQSSTMPGASKPPTVNPSTGFTTPPPSYAGKKKPQA